MTTKPTKPLFDPPQLRQLSIEEAPHLYEDGVYYPGAAIPGFEPGSTPGHPAFHRRGPPSLRGRRFLSRNGRCALA